MWHPRPHTKSGSVSSFTSFSSRRIPRNSTLVTAPRFHLVKCVGSLRQSRAYLFLHHTVLPQGNAACCHLLHGSCPHLFGHSFRHDLQLSLSPAHRLALVLCVFPIIACVCLVGIGTLSSSWLFPTLSLSSSIMTTSRFATLPRCKRGTLVAFLLDTHSSDPVKMGICEECVHLFDANFASPTPRKTHVPRTRADAVRMHLSLIPCIRCHEVSRTRNCNTESDHKTGHNGVPGEGKENSAPECDKPYTKSEQIVHSV